MAKKQSRRAATGQQAYARIIEEIFRRHRGGRSYDVAFSREDIEATAIELGFQRPRNLGDVIYTFRFRRDLPESIRRTAPAGKSWVIRLAGDGRYRFQLTKLAQVKANPQLNEIKIPDATPGIIEHHALSDEQALLAKVRYNRLLDVFTGVTCYALQSHLRTKVQHLGQCEIDELYVGIDRSGTQFVFPVQAKGGSDRLGAVQIEQDLAVCQAKFPSLYCRPIGVQFLDDSNSVVMFEFIQTGNDVSVAREAHYRLTSPSEISDEELNQYRVMLESEC